MRNTCSLSLLLASLACSAEPQPLTWESVDIAAVRRDLETPTAIIDDARLNATLASLGVNLYFLWQGIQVIEWFYDAASESDYEPQMIDVPFNLTGTQVYLKMACPGVGGTSPDPEFGHGEVVVYSPTLTQENVERAAFRGQALAVFEACEGQYLVFEGDARMAYETETQSIALVTAMQFLRDVDGGADDDLAVVGRFDAPMLRDGSVVSVSLAQPDDTRLTLAIDLDDPDEAFEIYGVDGVVSCRRTEDGSPPCDMAP